MWNFVGVCEYVLTSVSIGVCFRATASSTVVAAVAEAGAAGAGVAVGAATSSSSSKTATDRLCGRHTAKHQEQKRAIYFWPPAPRVKIYDFVQ